MRNSIETEKYKLRQELEMIRPVLESKLQKAKDTLKEGDLEALQLIAEGKGICSFKFNNDDWINSMLMTTDGQSLSSLLVLLWQSQELKKIPHDPIDLRIARSKRKIHEEKENESIIWGNDDENSADNSEDDDVAFSEDGINYLIGPYEIDLRRKDQHHSLFDDFRKSCERRQSHFLNSKHLPKACKLSGIDVYSYGFKFNRAVLEKAAASLEELNIEDLLKVKQLDVLENIYMPRLRRLNLWLPQVVEETEKPPFVFPTPSESHIGLQYLRAHIPRPALESLLSNNAKTLLELHLKVGTAHNSWDMWPTTCRDLDKLLMCCKGTLRRLVLIRDLYAHTRASCKDQVDSLKQNFPGLNVTCENCSSK